MAVVVGYLPSREGRAALAHGVDAAVRRHLPLVVVSSKEDTTEAVEADLAGFTDRLHENGLAYEVRHMPRSSDPADDLLQVARGRLRRGDRHRPAASVPGRQAHPRQQRPAHPAGRHVPRAGRQGRVAVGRLFLAGEARGGPAAGRGPVRPARGHAAWTSRCAWRSRSRGPAGCSTACPGRPTGSTRRRRRRAWTPTCWPPRWPARRPSTDTTAAWRARLQDLAVAVRDELRRRRGRGVGTGRGRRRPAPSAQALPGFGDQKAKIFLALLGKQLGVCPEGWQQAAGSTARTACTARPPTSWTSHAGAGARVQAGAEGRRPGRARLSPASGGNSPCGG